MGLDTDPFRRMLNSVERQKDQLLPRTAAAAQPIATRAESFMRERAPWNDQTGEARRQLNAGVEVDESAHGVTIYAQHGVDYGIYLENKYGGQNGVLRDTLRVIGADVRDMLKG